MKTILLTGGTGYIGSHTAVELLNAGFNVVLVDDLTNSKRSVVDRIEQITQIKVSFHCINVVSKELVADIFKKHSIDAVIHFAGLKAVAESVQNPLMYYRNNIDSILTLLEVMNDFGCKKIIFSSSATVYGTGNNLSGFVETDEVGHCSNPYGRTKYFIEQILQDQSVSDPLFTPIVLRYFNPVGAHESGLIGEDPNGIPNNLMPIITRVASGKQTSLNVFGDDYDTPDGTCIRDYIHVVDLAKGHVAALEYAFNNIGCDIFNLGTGNGTSVLEMVRAFEIANSLTIPYRIASRRPGDVPYCVADPSKANQLLNWHAKKDIYDMCRDSWRWQQNSNRENQSI